MRSAIVDIEFAHLDMVPLDVAIEEEEVETSAILARSVIEGLNHAHLSWTTSVLIDDKRIEGRTVDIDSALQRVSRLIGPVPVHRALMERCLTELKSDFIALFDRRRGSSIERDFHRYQVSREGRLGCSQDIAVWTAVRLGFIPAAIVSSRVPAAARFGFGRESDPAVLLSILPERYRVYEERASDKFLKSLDNGDVLRRTVHYYFMPGAGDDSNRLRTEVIDVITRIGDGIRQLEKERE